ncbi:hypothetical protein Ddc_04156 [Ditylenchus destructor]|nr:hypothetical protein Ddc_04156 [Ditylenchus destructor]
MNRQVSSAYRIDLCSKQNIASKNLQSRKLDSHEAKVKPGDSTVANGRAPVRRVISGGQTTAKHLDKVPSQRVQSGNIPIRGIPRQQTVGIQQNAGKSTVREISGSGLRTSTVALRPGNANPANMGLVRTPLSIASSCKKPRRSISLPRLKPCAETGNAVQPVKALAAIAVPKIVNRAHPNALTQTKTRPFGIYNNSTPKPGRLGIVESTRCKGRQSPYLSNIVTGHGGISITGISPVLSMINMPKPLACKPNTKVESNDSEPSDATFCLDKTYCLNDTYDIEPAPAKPPTDSQDDDDSHQPSDATFQLDKTYCLNDTYDVL